MYREDGTFKNPFAQRASEMYPRLWKESHLSLLAQKEKITPEEFKAITGQPYHPVG